MWHKTARFLLNLRKKKAFWAENETHKCTKSTEMRSFIWKRSEATLVNWQLLIIKYAVINCNSSFYIVFDGALVASLMLFTWVCTIVCVWVCAVSRHAVRMSDRHGERNATHIIYLHKIMYGKRCEYIQAFHTCVPQTPLWRRRKHFMKSNLTEV